MESTLIELIGVGGLTAGITAYLNYLISKRSSKRDDFAILLNERKEEIDFLRQDRTEIRGELEEAKERIMQLERRVNSQQVELTRFYARDVTGIEGKAIDLEILLEIIGEKYDIKPKEIK